VTGYHLKNLMGNYSPAGVAAYWDTVAPHYLELFREEFQSKPYDLAALAEFAAGLGPGARVCDAGCGPCGHVARILANHGLEVVGIDISPRCIELARIEQPNLEFQVMDLARLDFAVGELDGLLAYYSLHYQPKVSLPAVFAGFARVLRPGGRVLIVAKQGEGEGWIEDPLGSGQQIFWCSFQLAELETLLAGSGLRVAQSAVRAPLPAEAAVPRLYVIGER